jgi:hypothetical protein
MKAAALTSPNRSEHRQAGSAIADLVRMCRMVRAGGDPAPP